MLQVEIEPGEKKESVFHGVLVLNNAGGGELKGTIKSTHPCLKVQMGVFRGNGARVQYNIDENDRPGSLTRVNLIVTCGADRQEIPLERLLPPTKWKQLTTSVYEKLRNLRGGKKS